MQLIWFRQDLRIQDHTALWHATQAGPCIALVIISPEQWALHNDAAVKIDFVAHDEVIEVNHQQRIFLLAAAHAL